MDDFALGKVIYEARIREAWGKHADARLQKYPYPRHRAYEAEQSAEADLAMACARAVIKTLGGSHV